MPSQNSHAAKIDDQAVVTAVIVIPYQGDDDALITAYCNSIGLTGTWIDTSYTGSRRGKFAGVGDTYDENTDLFVSPDPPAPEPMPDQNANEEAKQ